MVVVVVVAAVGGGSSREGADVCVCMCVCLCVFVCFVCVSVRVVCEGECGVFVLQRVLQVRDCWETGCCGGCKREPVWHSVFGARGLAVRMPAARVGGASHARLTLACRYSLSPGGLASNAYNGHTFWDCETWMYPSL